MTLETKTLFCRKVIYFALGLTAIVLGLLIYLIFRPNTHISKIVSLLFGFDSLSAFDKLDASFLKFYFVDYLWAFAFSCWLHCVFIDIHKKSELYIFLIVSLTGVSYEIMQFFDIIPGTGDVWDCLLYILAGWTVNILNIQKEILL